MRQTDKEGEEREERQRREERERGNTEKRREREREREKGKWFKREREGCHYTLLQSIIISLWRMEAGDSLRLVFPPPLHTHTHTQVQHFLCLSLSTLS